MVLLPISPWLGGGESYVEVDSCLVSIINGLNGAGIKTSSCCCGHGEGKAYICLEDGRYIWFRDSKKTVIFYNWTDVRVDPPKKLRYICKDNVSARKAATLILEATGEIY
jgi:hypothetical protein